MASSIATPKAAAGSNKPNNVTASIQPIQILPNALARWASYAQPALQASLFLLRFNSLVEDPVWTMRDSLVAVAIIQVAYALLCLPPAGSESTKPIKKARPGEKKKAESAGPKPVLAAFLSLIMTALVTPVLHIVFVLFGAPLITHVSNTLLLSAHLSVIGLFPLFYVHGVDPGSWAAVSGFSAPMDETFGGLWGAVIGAWLGAVPIPLDWDREWQKWPVTILCGLYAGHILGKLIGGTIAFGKRFASVDTTAKLD